MRSRILTICAVAVVVSGTVPALPAAASSAPSSAASSAPATPSRATRFDQINLVSDVAGQAVLTDPKLVNAWGIAMGKTVWVSSTRADVATVYSGGLTTIKKERTEVRIPGGAPTGQVFNDTGAFLIKGRPATFIFASPSGAITAWNAEVDPDDAIIAQFRRDADYKGLALMKTNRGPFLLAADFAHGQVHVYDGDWNPVRLSRRQFQDPFLPRNYAPFNVEIVGRSVYVAYAKRDPQTGRSVAGTGLGFVSRFSASGRFLGRVAARGPLNAPWAMIRAPRGFGAFAGALLIGNFGDGSIHAYRNGRHLGALRRADGRPIVIPGLWDLEPGTQANGGTDAIWFSAGPDGAEHGLLGLIAPAGTRGRVTAAAAPSSSPTPTPVGSASGGPTPSSGRSSSGY